MNYYQRFFGEGDWKKAYGFWHLVNNRTQKQIQSLKRHILLLDKPSIRILDLGCGEGDELYYAITDLREREYSITGVDLSHHALALYHEALGDMIESTYEQPMERVLQKDTGEYDLILLSHSLYNIDLDSVLQPAFDKLNDTGRMVIYQESEHSSVLRIRKRFWNQVHDQPFSLNSAETIEDRMLGKCILNINIINYQTDLAKIALLDQGIERKLIPFLFYTHKFDDKTRDDIKAYINKISDNGYLNNIGHDISLRHSYG